MKKSVRKELSAKIIKIYKSYNDDLVKIIKSINKKEILLMDAIDPNKRKVNSPGIWDYLAINEKKLSNKKSEIELALLMSLLHSIHSPFKISAMKKNKRYLMVYHSFLLLASFQNCEDIMLTDAESTIVKRSAKKGKLYYLYRKVKIERARLNSKWAFYLKKIKKMSFENSKNS